MDRLAQSGPETEFAEIIFQAIQKKLGQKRSEGLDFQGAILPVYQEVLAFSQEIVQEIEPLAGG